MPAPLAWALRFLPHYFSEAPAAFHHELMSDLASSERRLICRIAPRGHAKSACASLAYPLWSLCEGRRRNIVIVSYEASLARQFVRDIRLELESNERIREEYGDLCAAEAAPPSQPAPRATRRKSPPASRRRTKPKWTADQFITAGGAAVHAKGCGSGFRGVRVGPQRPDLVILDDIEHDQQVRSPQRRRKLEHWLRRVVMPALAPDGQLVVIGSLLHFDSLLANLSDRRRFPRWDYRVYRALEFTRAADGQYYPAPLWPARWPVERLYEERERVGTLAFEQEYQANPIDDTRRPFKPEWLEPATAPPGLDGAAATLVAVDPATGAAGGDFFAMWVGSVDPSTGVIYTRALSVERIGVVEQVKRILAAFERWRPVRIGIEVVGYQAALQQILAEEGRRRGTYLPVVAIKPQGSKIARIEGLAPFLENGTFRFATPLDPEVEAQFLQFPAGAHDDAPDVCVMGLELARTLRGAGVGVEVARARRNGARREGW